MFDIIYRTTAATRPGRTVKIDKVVIIVPFQAHNYNTMQCNGGSNLNIKDKISVSS